MIYIRNQIFTLILPFIITSQFAYSATVKDIFSTKLDVDIAENYPVPVVVRIPRETTKPLHETKTQTLLQNSQVPVESSEKVVRKARDSKYYEDRYGSDTKNADRSLKPEDNPEDTRSIKGSTALGKRCSTCDSGYLGSSYSRGRDGGYDRYYDRDPYSSGRDRYDRYDPYDRYDRDRYMDRYDDYDMGRDYRGRNRYSTYDRYEPRDRYYDRGIGYDNRGYYNDYRDDYYSPSHRARYDPYDDYYSRGSGYDSISREGGGGYSSGRPEAYGGYGGYAKGYTYGERDRYGAYGGGYGGGGYGGVGYGAGGHGRGGYRGGSYGGAGGYGGGSYGGGGYGGGGYGGGGYGAGGYGGEGYGSYSSGGYGGYGGTSGYGSSSYGGSRSRYPYSDYDTAYRPTSYLYDRPSSTTTDMPKSSDGESNTKKSPSQTSTGRS